MKTTTLTKEVESNLPKVGNRKVYIAMTKHKGRGVFAKKDIKKGEVIFIAKGNFEKLIIHDESDSQLGPNWIGIADSLWLSPEENNALTYLNHSCEPNVGFKGRVCLVAMKNIRKGEEITTDYSFIEGDKLWSMKCNCSTSSCRKIIRSVHFLPQKQFSKCAEYIPLYFRKLYLKQHGQQN